MKRILLVLIILIMAAIFMASYAVRQAPVWLRSAVESTLGKSVTIRQIDFQFPTTFILTGVAIAEKEGPFAGEPEFTAEEVRVSAVPTSLRGDRLVIDEIDVSDATVVVRLFGGRLYHAFSRKPVESTPAAASASAVVEPSSERPLSVALLRLRNGRFQFADYDVAERGFVLEAEKLEARISGLQVPSSGQKTAYALEGQLLQGREEKPAAFSVSGSTVCSTLDTSARAELKNLHLPYFEPYVSRVTTAVIEEGYLDVRIQSEIRERQLSADAELAFTSLYFKALEGDNQLFGLSATEIVDFIKDSSGRLRIPISIRWSLDRKERLREVLRRSIEASLKRTVFGNVGALLEKAILRIGEKGLDTPEKATETVLKKIKDFLKY